MSHHLNQFLHVGALKFEIFLHTGALKFEIFFLFVSMGILDEFINWASHPLLSPIKENVKRGNPFTLANQDYKV